MLYIRDGLDYTALAVNGVVENFVVRTSTKTNERNVVRVYHRSLCQQGSNNVLF